MIFTPYGMPEPGDAYLASTAFLDADNAVVRTFAQDAVDGAHDPAVQAVRLFYAVRDRFRYDPFAIWLTPDAFKASAVIRQNYGFCITKAVLLAAAARAVGIQAAIGLSDVVNHFTSEKLKARMGNRDVFIHHGYALLLLDGRWVKAAPAFNIELCERFDVPPTEFDGTSDALFQRYDAKNNLRMEYLKDHGVWSDLPFDRIKSDMESFYPPAFNYGRIGVADERFGHAPSTALHPDHCLPRSREGLPSQ